MKKWLVRNWKKLTVAGICGMVGCIMVAYVSLGLFLEHIGPKGEMNGFDVLNGTIKILATDADYVKIGDNQYIYNSNQYFLNQLIPKEYDSYRYIGPSFLEAKPLDKMTDSEICKVVVVLKDGKEYKMVRSTILTELKATRNLIALNFYPKTGDG